MADSLPAKALSKLDLPALGRPAITTFMPSRIMDPCLALAFTVSSLSMILYNALAIFPSDKKSTSSSGKSIAASTYKRKLVTCSTN